LHFEAESAPYPRQNTLKHLQLYQQRHHLPS
jgi:hypothetical protein